MSLLFCVVLGTTVLHSGVHVHMSNCHRLLVWVVTYCALSGIVNTAAWLFCLMIGHLSLHLASLHFVWGVAEANCIVAMAICLSVPHRIPTLLHSPDVNWGHGRGFPLVVQCWADLQLVPGFHCYDNIAPNAKCQQVYSLYAWLKLLIGVEIALYLIIVYLSIWITVDSLPYCQLWG